MQFFAEYKNCKQYTLLTYKKDTTLYTNKAGSGQNKAKLAQQHSPRAQAPKIAQQQNIRNINGLYKRAACKKCGPQKVLRKKIDLTLVFELSPAFITKIASHK